MQVYFCQFEENEVYDNEIKNLFNIALKMVGVKENVSINIIDVSPDTIKEMNNDYRGVDRVTDVLSFPMINSINEIKDEIDAVFGECNIGDIYINPTRAKEQAVEYGHSYKREYCFLALHGILHLLGFDHIKEDEEKIMFDLQDKILKEAKIGRD